MAFVTVLEFEGHKVRLDSSADSTESLLADVREAVEVEEIICEYYDEEMEDYFLIKVKVWAHFLRQTKKKIRVTRDGAAGVVPHRPADPSSSRQLSRHGGPGDKASNPSSELQKVAPMKMKSGKEYACFLRCAGRMLERPARASTLVLAASFRSRPSPFLHPQVITRPRAQWKRAS